MKFFERIFKKAESEKKTESNTVENEIPKKYVNIQKKVLLYSCQTYVTRIVKK